VVTTLGLTATGAKQLCHALAIHEAAHAVVGEALGLKLVNIKVDLTRWRGGATFEQGFAPEMWRKDLLVSLAGEAAQRRVDAGGETLRDERGNCRASDDWRKVDVAVSRYNHHADSQVEDRISEARIADGLTATSELLDMLWPAVQAVATAIEVGAGAMSAAEVQRVLNSAIPQDVRVAAAQRIEFIYRPFNSP
jgi:hypothetical protein